jgi:hypothetical protein
VTDEIEAAVIIMVKSRYGHVRELIANIGVWMVVVNRDPKDGRRPNRLESQSYLAELV